MNDDDEEIICISSDDDNELSLNHDDNDIEIVKFSQIASSPWRSESFEKRIHQPSSSDISNIVSSQPKRPKWMDFADELDRLDSSPIKRDMIEEHDSDIDDNDINDTNDSNIHDIEAHDVHINGSDADINGHDVDISDHDADTNDRRIDISDSNPLDSDTFGANIFDKTVRNHDNDEYQEIQSQENEFQFNDSISQDTLSSPILQNKRILSTSRPSASSRPSTSRSSASKNPISFTSPSDNIISNPNDTTSHSHTISHPHTTISTASRSKSLNVIRSSSSSSSSSPPPISSSQPESSKFMPTGRSNFRWDINKSRDKSSSAKPASRTSSKMSQIDKDAEKLRRQAQKEQREIEKQKERLMKEINKKRTTRQDCCNELLVDLHGKLATNSIADVITEALNQVNAITCRDSNSVLSLNYIGFRRKKTAEYDDEQETYVPIEETIVTEKHVVLTFTAEEFIQQSENKREFLSKLQDYRKHFKDFNIIYLVEGYAEYMRKIANTSNRQITNQIRQLLNSEPAPDDDTRHSTSNSTTKDKNYYDALLIEVSVFCGYIIFHTVDAVDTAEWIGNFACDIYAAPYKQIQYRNTDIKAGTNPPDTVAKAFGHVSYVTPSIAQGVSEIYPTMYRVSDSVKKRGEGAFTGIKSPSMGRLLNSTVSTALTRLFSSRDASTVVMEGLIS